MRAGVLADTVALLFWLHDSPRLSMKARAVFAKDSDDVVVSVVSVFEIRTKVSLGKLPTVPKLAAGIGLGIRAQGFTILDLETGDAELAGEFPFHHKDPFDRLIIAQALVRGLPVVTSDAIFEAYGVRRIW